MTILIKVADQGHTLVVSFAAMPSYDVFASALRQQIACGSDFHLKYIDEEGDFCTLVESTYPDFLTTATVAPTGDVEFFVSCFSAASPITFAQVPTSPSTRTAPQSARKHSSQAKTKSAWAADPRALDELLQQFADECDISEKKCKKRKKKKQKKSSSFPVANQPQQDVPDLPACAYSSGPSGGFEEDIGMDSHVGCGAIGGEEPEIPTEMHSVEARQCFADDGPQRTVSPSSLTVAPSTSKIASPCTLRKSPSCPGIISSIESIDNEQQHGSLVSQAWPFIDTENFELDESLFGGHHITPSATVERATTYDNTFPQNVSQSCCYQQVVWMPVLVNCFMQDLPMPVDSGGLGQTVQM